MIALHVDPALLALPNGLAETAVELHELIDRVVELSTSIRDYDLFRLVKSYDLEERLFDAGAFPSFEGIQEVIADNDLEGVFSPKDILLSILFIMERSIASIDLFGLESVNSSEPNDEMKDTFDRYPVKVRDMAINALTSLCLLVRERKILDYPLAISGHPLLDRKDILFVGEVLNCVEAEGQSGIRVPADVSATIKIVKSPLDVLDYVKAKTLWERAEDIGDIHAAIEGRVREIMRAANINHREFSRFSMGSHFLESLRDNQAFGASRFSSVTLDICARIIIGKPKYEVNDFKASRSDGATAKRTHVTKHKPAVRLMLWVINDDEIEFANIGQKADLEIEKGVLAEKHHCSYEI